MSIFVNRDTRVLVQGITGSQGLFHTEKMLEYGTRVVGGVTPTTYGPKQQVKWGEVLKMVLLGAGHPAQTEGTGANWAANYLTYAYNNGIVTSNKIDLTKPITRLEMAELAAKALGLSAQAVQTSLDALLTQGLVVPKGAGYTLRA